MFVDEYQDCTREQHDVVRQLAGQIPCCIFDDPLQSIFDFRGQQPVDWDADVFPAFPKAAELTTPWRWKNAENPELAEWLKTIRSTLEQGGPIDLNAIEARLCNDIGTKVITLPADPNTAERIEAQLRDFIHRGVSDAINAAGVSIQLLTPDNVLGFVTDVYQAAFEALQTLGDAEAEK